MMVHFITFRIWITKLCSFDRQLWRNSFRRISAVKSSEVVGKQEGWEMTYRIIAVITSFSQIKMIEVEDNEYYQIFINFLVCEKTKQRAAFLLPIAKDDRIRPSKWFYDQRKKNTLSYKQNYTKCTHIYNSSNSQNEFFKSL